MKKHFSLLILISLVQIVVAQEKISGRVLDSETGEPVLFVNIGIRELGIGTVSDSKGYYDFSFLEKDYKVLFSSVGYSPQTILLSDLRKNPEVKLDPKTEVLQEVVINASNYGKDVILGEKLDKKGHSIGFGSRFLGTEIGAYIKVKKEALLKSAHFTINFTGADSLLFRVNLYQFKNGVVGEKLIKENIIIKAPQERGTFDIDLRSYNLTTSEDVLLSLEWIQDDNGKGNEGLMFRSKTTLSGGNLYTKRTSQSDFLKLSDEIPSAPAIKMGFYLVGVQK